MMELCYLSIVISENKSLMFDYSVNFLSLFCFINNSFENSIFF